MIRGKNLEEYHRFAAGVCFRVLGVIVSLLSAIVTARGLGASGRGSLFTCTSAAQVLAQLLSFGMPSAVILVVASRPELGRRALGRALTSSAGAGLVVLLVGASLLKLSHPKWIPPTVAELMPLVAGLVATQVLLAWCSSLTQSLGKVDRLPLIEFIYRSISVAWSWTALFLIHIPFRTFLASLIIVDAVCAASWLIYVMTSAQPSSDAPVWPSEWRRWSMKAYLPLLLSSGMRRIDVFLLSSLSGVRATGLYSVAVQAMDLCQIAPVFLGQKAMFAFSAGHGDSPTMKRLRKALPLAVIVIMGTAGCTADYWARWFFGSEFAGIGPIVLALAPGAGALAWETIAVQEIAAAGFPIQLSIAWLCTFSTAGLLMISLIPLFGVVGAAVALSASYIVMAALVFRIRRKVRASGAPLKQRREFCKENT